jgi:hypothetical protein
MSNDYLNNEDLKLSYNDNLVFINPETFSDEQAAKALEDILLKKSIALKLDHNLASLAYGEKQASKTFFENVLDQPAHMSKDYMRMRNFIMDWYSANKTLVTKSRKILDLNLLSIEELNTLILSFGFPYPANIISKSHKIKFLTSLIELYQKKGTAFSLWSLLTLYGLKNVTISEWWLRYNETRNPKIFLKSKPIYPIESQSNKNLILEKELDFFDLDPYWHQDKYEIMRQYNNKDNKMSLPSITPYISISAFTSLSDLELGIAILQRKIFETLRYWIKHTLIPVDLTSIGITVVWQDLPIIDEPPTSLPSDDYIEYHPTRDTVFMISPTPKPTSIFANHRCKIAVRVVNEDESVSWTYYEPQHGASFIARKDSVVGANSLIKIEKINGYLNFKSYSVVKNAVIKIAESYIPNTRDDSTYVYNGVEWVRLGTAIPDGIFINKVSSKEIFRDVSLNGFSSLYSVYEVALAISYLHNGPYIETPNEPFPGSSSIGISLLNNFNSFDSNEDARLSYSEVLNLLPSLTEDEYDTLNSYYGGDGLSVTEILSAIRHKTHVYYNGDHAPLDGKYGPQDNIDDLYNVTPPYRNIKEEYARLYDNDLREDNDFKTTTFRHVSEAFPYKRDYSTDPKSIRENKLINYASKYTKISVPDGDHELGPQQNPKYYLKAINPEFFDEIENRRILDGDILLENILTDFEIHLKDRMEVIDSNFSYIQRGGDFLNKRLKKTIDFFKPFRVRILDFITSFKIENALLDSLIPGDNNRVGAAIDQVFYDKPFPLDIDQVNEFLSEVTEVFDMTGFGPSAADHSGSVSLAYDMVEENYIFTISLNFTPNYFSFYNGDEATSDSLISTGLIQSNVSLPNASYDSNNRVLTLLLSKEDYLINQTINNSIKLDIYTSDVSGVNGITNDVGYYCSKLYTRIPIFDAGLPMDDICLNTTKIYMADPFSSEYVNDQSSYGDISQGKVTIPDKPGSYLYVDRNTLDLNMTDTFFVIIKSLDPQDSTSVLFEYEISMDDDESVISGNVTEVAATATLTGNISLLDPEPITYLNNDINIVSLISFDEDSNEFVVTIHHNNPHSMNIVLAFFNNIPEPEDIVEDWNDITDNMYEIRIDREYYYSTKTSGVNAYLLFLFTPPDEVQSGLVASLDTAFDYISSKYP